MLHDSVSATLTVVAAGGISRRSADLRGQARRDLAVIERLNVPDEPGPANGGELAGWLYPVLAGADLPVTMAAPIPAVLVPPAVGAALAAWSLRRTGGLVPGLLGYLLFLAYYLALDISVAAQRDWQAPGFAVLGLLAIEARPGRGARVASALLFVA